MIAPAQSRDALEVGLGLRCARALDLGWLVSEAYRTGLLTRDEIALRKPAGLEVLLQRCDAEWMGEQLRIFLGAIDEPHLRRAAGDDEGARRARRHAVALVRFHLSAEIGRARRAARRHWLVRAGQQLARALRALGLDRTPTGQLVLLQAKDTFAAGERQRVGGGRG